jgi:hypothetical protein
VHILGKHSYYLSNSPSPLPSFPSFLSGSPCVVQTGPMILSSQLSKCWHYRWHHTHSSLLFNFNHVILQLWTFSTIIGENLFIYPVRLTKWGLYI